MQKFHQPQSYLRERRRKQISTNFKKNKLFILSCFRIFRHVLSTRYKLIIINPEKVLNLLDNKKGVLFIANHTSFIDPILALAHFWHKKPFRVVLSDLYMKNPILKWLIEFVKPVVFTDNDSIRRKDIAKNQQALQEVVTALKNGDDFLVFPSGRLKLSGEEQLKNSALVHKAAKEIPDLQIVGIRFSGLRGSSFSKANNSKANFLGCMKEGVKLSLKNFIFFAPKRVVIVETEIFTREIYSENRRTFNQNLENWFNHYLDENQNRHSIEPIKIVPYSTNLTRSLGNLMQRFKKKHRKKPQNDDRLNKV